MLDLTRLLPGPVCTLYLADLGADVVKIEDTSAGDYARHLGTAAGTVSPIFRAVNRNKRSLALDLKDPPSRDFARALALEADVVIENNRPGVMDRLGLGHERLAALNPKLVYCSISAFGHAGPRAAEGGFDLTIQAAAGVMSVTGESDDAPVKCGVPISDFASGLYGAFAIASALLRARATGIGAWLDIPMFGCTLAISALQTSEYFGTGQNPRKLGSAHPRNAPYQAFRAADGHFAIAAGNDGLWRAVLRAVGNEPLADDPRFLTPTLRARNQVALKEILERRFVERDVAHWIETFRAAGVPHSRINSYAEALADPQVEAMGWVQELELPSGARTRTFGSPIRIDGKNLPISQRPPALGEHSQDSVRPALREADPILQP